MAIYDTRLAGRREVAEGTLEFFIERPAGFTFRAGQFCDIILAHSAGADKQSYTHGFSFASAPHEEQLAVATRMRDTPFKRAIRALPDQTAVQLDANFGSFTLPKKPDRPVVFLIGGIGITPVRSMVAQATHDRSEQPMTLLYANRTPAQAAFTDDFQQFAGRNPHFTFVPVYTDVAGNDSPAEKGRVDADMIRRHVPDLAVPVYYLSGPAGMVRAMYTILIDQGVDEDDIRTEEFEGY